MTIAETLTAIRGVLTRPSSSPQAQLAAIAELVGVEEEAPFYTYYDGAFQEFEPGPSEELSLEDFAANLDANPSARSRLHADIDKLMSAIING